MKRVLSLILVALVLQACANRSSTGSNSYLDYSGRDDAFSGGAKLIPINTPKGVFWVWTKRVGNNPRIKVLLLHGGAACWRWSMR